MGLGVAAALVMLPALGAQSAESINKDKATPKAVGHSASHRSMSGTILAVTPSQAPAGVHQPLEFAVQTKGPCGQVKLDFGDGTSGATSYNVAVSSSGGAYFYKIQHTYAAVGKLTVTATGALNCTGKATAIVNVLPGSGQIGGTPPPVAQPGSASLPPPFALLSVSYAYGPDTVTAKAEGTRVTLPYPASDAPKNGTVVFSFRPFGVPDAALQSVLGRPCSATARGFCHFRFSLTREFGDIGPTIDLRADAGVSLSSEAGWIVHVRLPDLDLRPLFKAPGRYLVFMEVSHQGKSYITKQAFLDRGDEIGSDYFGRFIYPTFQSDRCTTCHSMGDHDAIVHQHELNNVIALRGYSANEVAPGKTAICAGCHRAPHVTDWRTPPLSQGINWKEMKTSSEVCNTVISHLRPPGMTLGQLKQNLHNHFHNDPRVKWAISDALSAPPLVKQLERAKPGSWDKWLEIIDPWIDADRHCPAD
jgi:hypothetical protein